MKKILLSLLTVGSLGGLVYGATQAFFSDTETSTGNVLQAGAIDLKIDNTSYRTNNDGVLEASTQTSWQLTDLTVEKFFNFFDLKPGDQGEDTISIHVNDNDAWACANLQITGNFENGLVDPELELADDATVGELAQELNFAFWNDDGDNIFESNEDVVVSGPASNVLAGGTLALSQPAGIALFGNSPLAGATTNYIGKYYCYGSFIESPITQDNVNTSNPVIAGTGFTCNGTNVTNLSQTDQLVGDIRFYAEQSRNNPNFSCSQVAWPTSSPLVSPVASPSPAPTATPTATPTPTPTST